MSRTATTVSGRGRGFASMTVEQKWEIAHKGGKAAWKLGTAHRWTSGPDGTAAKAGRIGGSISRRGPSKKGV